jgi:hypothetical protein
MAGNKAHDTQKKKKKKQQKKSPAAKCGAKTRAGKKCGQAAGWGTDHPGSGKCKLHGGASTGPKSAAGKERISKNAIKHGAYIDKIISDLEREIYDHLHQSTIEKYKLDQENVIHMATLHRACITYIKLLRLDEWELEEEFEPHDIILNPRTGENLEDNEGNPILKKIPVFDKDGNVTGESYGKIRRLRWSKNAPDWEKHFQKYIQLLGMDRATEVKLQGAQSAAQSVVDGFAWLWGQKSEEE